MYTFLLLCTLIFQIIFCINVVTGERATFLELYDITYIDTIVIPCTQTFFV